MADISIIVQLAGFMVQEEKVFSVKSIKFLAVRLKSNLDWEDEINEIVRKCENPMKIVNCVKHIWWGADPVILLRLYKAFIRSRMEYGAFSFHKFKKKQVQKLENLGRAIAQAVQAVSRRFPTGAVRVRVQVR
jgi:hypothetical protein